MYYAGQRLNSTGSDQRIPEPERSIFHMTFLQRFRQSLEPLYTLPPAARYVVAFSGGVDSHVLLYCCRQLRLPVRAVHVHHGLQAVADEWVSHCQSVCDALGVPLTVLYVDVCAGAGQSPEEAARDARYQALEKNMVAGECLLTAQHRDDQAETLLLQLFRGGSSAGLAAMPWRRSFAKGVHIRPLLDFSRQEIEAFAGEQKLCWVEDPSNRDTRFDRNFLRQEIMPVLQRRWPQISTRLANVAALQADNLQVLDDMAAIDLAAVVRILPKQQLPLFHDIVSMLDITELKRLSQPRRFNLLRYWVRQSLAKSPSAKLLDEMENALLQAQADTEPQIRFNNYCFRKYRDRLYLLKPLPEIDTSLTMTWRPTEQEKITLPQTGLVLNAVDAEPEGLKPFLRNERLTLRFRRGGERFHPLGRAHSQQLKKLLQAAGVPPWDRQRIPLLYYRGELIAVVGFWISCDYAARGNESGWQIRVIA